MISSFLPLITAQYSTNLIHCSDKTDECIKLEITINALYATDDHPSLPKSQTRFYLYMFPNFYCTEKYNFFFARGP